MFYSWLITKNDEKSLYICHIIFRLFLPLCSHIPFVSGPKGPPFINAQRCDPWSTKHLKTQRGWKDMKDMRRDMKSYWRWRTLERVEFDMELVDRLSRKWRDFTLQYPAGTSKAKISSLNTTWQRLWTTYDTSKKKKKDVWPATESNHLLFPFERVDGDVFAAVSWSNESSMVMPRVPTSIITPLLQAPPPPT